VVLQRRLHPAKHGKREAAFDALASDLIAGEFEENGRSLVLYLHPGSRNMRMACEWLEDAIDHSYDRDRGRSQYLAHCWIPRRLLDAWFSKHRLGPLPELFQPQQRRRFDDAKVPAETGQGNQHRVISKPLRRTRNKDSIAVERARSGIAAVYPGRIPTVVEIRNKPFCAQVQAYLKRHDPPINVSDDSILRAAGRKK
jgi:hypothetical protein